MLWALRRLVLPWAVWLGAMGTAGWLWYGVNIGSSRGFVEGVAYGVAAPEIGRIASIRVQPGQFVRAGEVIATLDDSAIVAELAELDAERRRVEAELGAVATKTAMQVADDARGIEENVDATEIARQQARAERSVAVAELGALEEQIEAVKQLVDKRMADKRELAELLVKRAALRQQRTAAEGLIRQLDHQASSARARREGLPPDATVRATEPLRAELGVIFAQQQLLRLRQQAMSLHAPGDGEVTQVLLRPGELALAGALVATVQGGTTLTATGTPIVFACTSEAETARVQVGEQVSLSATEGGRTVLTGYVDRLAAQVVELPPRCWRDPRIPMWGRGVYIATDEPITLVPGQGFSITFTGKLSEHAARAGVIAARPPASSEAIAPPSRTMPPQAAANAMVVPASLRSRTRFEPSAALYSPARGRYLLASDDTGLPDITEKLPWLFAMDSTGHVDAEPIVLEGIDEVTDLEAIAAAPDGGVYLLASQSRSRKGKRPAARQVFAHVELTPTHARVTASVKLATLLEAAGQGRLASLGVADLDALDIEGMTATAAGGLLLGLKGPIDEHGEAAIWHMRDPQGLLGSSDLAAAELSVWGHVPLSVTADGASVPAGIAELLELPGGELLIAATAALADEPARQDGALFVVAGRAQLANPQRVRTFAGAKPEGLARTAAGDGIAVVFDPGDASPTWMELQWPAH